MNAAAIPKLALPFAIAAEDLDRWVDLADLGERIVFAFGPAIPRHAPVWTRATELVAEGLIATHHRRDDGAWEFIAVRRVAPDDVPPSPAATPALDEDDPDAIILTALRRAANFGLPCPTNAELARVARLKDSAAASYRIGKLIAAGIIQVEALGPNLPRIVTIVATRKRTARPAPGGDA